MAGRSLSPDPSVRFVAFIAAALLHLPLLLTTDPRERPSSNQDAMRVSFIAERAPEPIAEPLPRTMDDPSAIRSWPAAEASSPIPPIRPEDLRPPADWEISGAISAQRAIDAIIRDEAYRSLGPREKKHQIIEPEQPRPIFDEPKRRYGEVAKNALGYDSVWHNEHCYTQLEEPVSARPSASIDGVNPMTCVMSIGKGEPRGDLFEHLKKTYPDPHPPAHPQRDEAGGTPSSEATTNQE